MPQSDSFEMRGLGDFKVVQEPGVDGRGGKDAKNITDRGGGVVRFLLRVGPGGAWWDGDGSGAGRGATRQRAECRQLGGDLAQKRGETWEYGATLRTDPDFKVWGGGWNALMQVKPSGPDPGGLPLVFLDVVAASGGVLTARLQYNSPAGGSQALTTLREFTFKAGEWVAVRFRVRPHPKDGLAQASVDGDAWQGVSGVPVDRADVAEWDGKWGFYRKYWGAEMAGENWVEVKQAYRRRLPDAAAAPARRLQAAPAPARQAAGKPAPKPAPKPKLKGRLPPSALPALRALAGLDEGQVDAILQLVCLPENGDTDYDKAHEYCEFLGDGRGYTCTLYGACSGTGDLEMVFEELQKIQPAHPLLRYHDALRRCRGDAIRGIEPLGPKAHAPPRNLIPGLTAANGGKPDMAWREAVWRVYVKLYWSFADAFCAKRGECASRPGPPLKTPLALGFLVDAALNHGADMGSMRPILHKMAHPDASDPDAWLRDFVLARQGLLKSGFQDLDTSKTGDRCKLWLKLLDEKNHDFARPIRCADGYWGKGYKIE